MLLRCIVFLWILLCISSESHSQQVTTRDTLVVSRYKLSKRMKPFCWWYKDSLNNIPEDHLDQIPFTDTIPRFTANMGLVNKTVYLKCIIRNNADSVFRDYFNPGFYFRVIKVFELDSLTGKTILIPDYPGEAEGFKLIYLAPLSTKQYYFKLRTVRSDLFFDPVMVPDYYRAAFLLVIQRSLKYTTTITFIISGFLLMMIFYSLAVYVLNRNISFLYYSGYAFFLGLMFFLIAFTFRDPSPFAYFFDEYLDFILQAIGTFFYLAFLRKFLDSKKVYPVIHRLIVIEQLSIIVSTLLYSGAYFITKNFDVQYKIELITKSFWMLSTIVFVILAIRVRKTLLYYLAAGHAFLILFAFVSFYMILFNPSRNNFPEAFRSAVFYFETGVCIELIFFLAALASKNKRDIIDRTKEGERLKIKNERQELEQQLAVFSAKQEERNRISADMHDELGSGLTAIRLMSEIVKQKMKPAVLPEIDRISHSANELINKSNTLIWTMKSDNDTLQSLVAYIRTYALEFFENTSIHCTVKMPSSIRAIELSGEKRRNIFLTVKETLNNTLKHSKAQQVQMVFEVGDELMIRISDDGVGIEFDKLRQFGSGLKNMKKRIEGIGGHYTISNNEDGGVMTLIALAI